MKAKWSIEEDMICCKVVVEECIVKGSTPDVKELISIIKKHPIMATRSNGSIRMKLQNIKHLLDKLGIPNNLNLKALENASEQNKSTLLDELEKHNLVPRNY